MKRHEEQPFPNQGETYGYTWLSHGTFIEPLGSKEKASLLKNQVYNTSKLLGDPKAELTPRAICSMEKLNPKPKI